MEELKINTQGVAGTVDSLTSRVKQVVDAFGLWKQAAAGVARSQQQVTKTVSVTTRAIKRTITAFDRINRLAAPSGSRTATVKTTTLQVPEIDTNQLETAVRNILKTMEPLNSYDFGPLTTAFQNLWNGLQPILSGLGGIIGTLWQGMLSPFLSWVVSTLAPALANGLTGSISAVSAGFERATGVGKLLWQALQPVVSFIGQQASTALGSFAGVVQGVAQTVQQHAPGIQGIFTAIGEKATLTGQTLGPVFQTVGGLFSGLSDRANAVAGTVRTAFEGITGFLSGTFSGSWSNSWEGIKNTLRGVVNSIIGIINGMLTAMGSGINNVIRAANKVKFTVPAWVPGLGGRTYGFSMNPVTIPQVPYLARGAVLPANKPFLAMVGDQRHGTNVEAPLSTIQEAVANVMTDQKGQEAVVGKLSQILEAVLGIRLGDREVYEAHDRYRNRMAMIHGGI